MLNITSTSKQKQRCVDPFHEEVSQTSNFSHGTFCFHRECLNWFMKSCLCFVARRYLQHSIKNSKLNFLIKVWVGQSPLPCQRLWQIKGNTEEKYLWEIFEHTHTYTCSPMYTCHFFQNYKWHIIIIKIKIRGD